MHPEKGPAVEHTAGPEECGLFVAGEVGDAVKALLQVGVGGDAVGHLAVVEQWVRANESARKLTFLGAVSWWARVDYASRASKKAPQGFFPRRTIRRVDAVRIHPLGEINFVI